MPIRLEIYLDGNTPKVRFHTGSVTCEDPKDPTPPPRERHPCGKSDAWLDWFAANERYWVVVFEGSSPFHHGKRILTGGGNDNSGGGQLKKFDKDTAFKYWVLCEDDSDPPRLVASDPKIVISDTGGTFDPGELISAVVGELEDFARGAERVSGSALALRELIADLARSLEEEVDDEASQVDERDVASPA